MFFPDFAGFGFPELICVLGVAGLLLITINYLSGTGRLSRFSGHRLTGDNVQRPVSVIICAKNEDENLTEFLPRVLTQEYPEFEVIVVNDCSWDNTETVIDEFSRIFPNLRKATIKEDPYYKHGKKFAMLVGIKAARFEHMVFTDADCYPVSNSWLQEMAQGFSEEKKIVLGYGGYEKQKSFLNRLIRFDTLMIATQFMSAAIRKRAYMGVGRNLAYTKGLFFAHKGFSGHYHIASGDDDLFVNEASTASNTNICYHENAITLSKPKTSFRMWRIQKARHLSTSPLYRTSTKAPIMFNYFSQYFFYAVLLLQVASTRTVLLLPILLILKISIQVLCLRKAARRLGEKDLIALAPLLELTLLFIYPIFHVTKMFSKNDKWNH